MKKLILSTIAIAFSFIAFGQIAQLSGADKANFQKKMELLKTKMIGTEQMRLTRIFTVLETIEVKKINITTQFKNDPAKLKDYLAQLQDQQLKSIKSVLTPNVLKNIDEKEMIAILNK